MKRFLFNSPVVLLILGIFICVDCGGSKAVRVEVSENNTTVEPARKLSPIVNINRRAYNHFTNGSIFETIGEYYLANEQYREALKFDSTSQEILYSCAVTSFRIRDFDNALSQAKRLSPRDLRAWLLIGDCFRVKDEVDSALYAYNRVVELDTTNFEVYYLIAQYYERREQFDSAVMAFEKVVEYSPGFNTFQQLGNLQMRIRKLDDARESYLHSIALNDGEENVRSFIGLSVINEEYGDTVKAIEYLEKAAARSPRDYLIHTRLLGFYERNQDFYRAIETARTIIPLMPLDRNIPSRLGILYYTVDSLAQADSVFMKLINEGDDNVITHYYAGRTAYFMEDYRKAIGHFIRVTELADSVLDGWMNLAMTYRAFDSTDREIETYHNGLPFMNNIDDSTGLLFSMAVALERDSLFDRSVETFERIINRIPDHGPSLNYLGYMLADRGERLDYALELIKKALDVDPENGAYIDSYGWVLYRLGQYKKALKQLKKAYSQIDDDPVVLDHLAETFKALGDSASADKYWNEALEHDPDNAAIREKLGR